MAEDRATAVLRGRISAADRAGQVELAQEFRRELAFLNHRRFVERTFGGLAPLSASEIFRLVASLEEFAQQQRESDAEDDTDDTPDAVSAAS